MNILTEPFQKALYIIEQIEDAGHQAYFVGGCVRDLLLGRPIGDVDITTSATPDIIQSIFDETIPVGIEHGTVIVRHEQNSYEVTTFRIEGDYSDNRHPDTVQFIDKIDLDLARRDFTINALAMDKYGKLIDLFQGQKDLNKRLIRTVGNGYDRLKEDPLRILRALRFASQLGFSIEEETLQAMKNTRASLEGLAVERITVELGKLFAGKSVQMALQYMHDLEIDKHLPIFNQININTKLLDRIRPVHSLAEVVTLLHQVNPTISIKEIVKAWKCSNKILKEALQLDRAIVYYKQHGFNKWLVYLLLPNLLESFARLSEILFQERVEVNRLLEAKNTLAIHSKSELAINGHDIIAMFPQKNKGPWIQEILKKIEKLVVLDELSNKKSDIKDWIKWNQLEAK